MSDPIIVSSDAQRICTLSGIEQKRLSGKLIELRDLEKMLDISIAEVTQAAEDEGFWAAAEISAKIIQLSCDLAIAILEEKTGLAGKTVSITYDVAKMVVDALNGDIGAKKAIIFSTNAKVDFIAEMLSSRGNSYGKVVSRTKTLVNLTNDLYEYWTGGGKETLTAKSNLVGARKTVEGQLMRIRQKIKETSEALSACDMQVQLVLP